MQRVKKYTTPYIIIGFKAYGHLPFFSCSLISTGDIRLVKICLFYYLNNPSIICWVTGKDDGWERGDSAYIQQTFTGPKLKQLKKKTSLTSQLLPQAFYNNSWPPPLWELVEMGKVYGLSCSLHFLWDWDQGFVIVSPVLWLCNYFESMPGVLSIWKTYLHPSFNFVADFFSCCFNISK